MSTLKNTYQKKIREALKSELKLSNIHEVPRVEKITLNVGLRAESKDPRQQEVVERTLTRISGQKPVKTKARKSIAGFKVREGMIVGMQVTLRGERMWDFLEKLVSFAFPRVRDFRGLQNSVVDRSGNLSVGFKEHMAFPEIRSDEVELIHGLQVTVTTNAKTRERGFALFRALGVPFRT